MEQQQKLEYSALSRKKIGQKIKKEKKNTFLKIQPKERAIAKVKKEKKRKEKK